MTDIDALVLAVLAGLSVAMLLPSRVMRVPRPAGSDRVAQVVDWRRQILAKAVILVRRRVRRDGRRAAACELVAALAAELRAGQPARLALDRASAANPESIGSRAAAVAMLGGDVVTELRKQAEDDALPELRALAALWQVAEGSGAGLARACDRLALALAESQRVRQELAAQLAGPKATARVLAVLPLFGIVLGNALGAEPLSWLLGSPIGWLALVIGIALEVAGLWWIHRLTSQVADRV